jgi:hypothetical protein
MIHSKDTPVIHSFIQSVSQLVSHNHVQITPVDCHGDCGENPIWTGFQSNRNSRNGTFSRWPQKMNLHTLMKWIKWITRCNTCELLWCGISRVSRPHQPVTIRQTGINPLLIKYNRIDWLTDWLVNRLVDWLNTCIAHISILSNLIRLRQHNLASLDFECAECLTNRTSYLLISSKIFFSGWWSNPISSDPTALAQWYLLGCPKKI